MTIRTRSQTVSEFLKEKDIKMANGDGINVNKADSITNQMMIRIWRDGIQTITTWSIDDNSNAISNS